MCVPNGKVKFFGSKKYVADRPGSVSGGSSFARCAASAISWIVKLDRPSVCGSGSAAAGASPTGTTGSDVPAAAAAAAWREYCPPSKETRDASAWSMWHAILCAFSFSFCTAINTAVPPTAVARLPNVPMPYWTTPVSPWITVTSLILTPNSSATICANEVSCPCPWGDAPVKTVTFPVGSIRTVALSQPPAGIACDGPSAQISTYVERPIPISRPSARAFFCSSRSCA